MNISSADIFNFEEFLKRMMDDRELALAILEKFCSDLPGRLAELENHIDGNDIRQTAFIAHLLKGEAANISALMMSRCAHTMELAAKSGNTDEMKNSLASLQENAGILLKSIEKTFV